MLGRVSIPLMQFGFSGYIFLMHCEGWDYVYGALVFRLTLQKQLTEFRQKQAVPEVVLAKERRKLLYRDILWIVCQGVLFFSFVFGTLVSVAFAFMLCTLIPVVLPSASLRLQVDETYIGMLTMSGARMSTKIVWPIFDYNDMGILHVFHNTSFNFEASIGQLSVQSPILNFSIKELKSLRHADMVDILGVWCTAVEYVVCAVYQMNNLNLNIPWRSMLHLLANSHRKVYRAWIVGQIAVQINEKGELPAALYIFSKDMALHTLSSPASLPSTSAKILLNSSFLPKECIDRCEVRRAVFRHDEMCWSLQNLQSTLIVKAENDTTKISFLEADCQEVDVSRRVMREIVDFDDLDGYRSTAYSGSCVEKTLDKAQTSSANGSLHSIFISKQLWLQLHIESAISASWLPLSSAVVHRLSARSTAVDFAEDSIYRLVPTMQSMRFLSMCIHTMVEGTALTVDLADFEKKKVSEDVQVTSLHPSSPGKDGDRCDISGISSHRRISEATERDTRADRDECLIVH